MPRSQNMQWFLGFFVKSTVYGALIVGAGYATMKLVTPSKHEMKERLDEYRRQRGLEPEVVDMDKYKQQIAMIKANARSDRPIWDVRFGVDSLNHSDQSTTQNKE